MTQEFPAQFPYNEDMNSGKPLGLGSYSWPFFLEDVIFNGICRIHGELDQLHRSPLF